VASSTVRAVALVVALAALTVAPLAGAARPARTSETGLTCPGQKLVRPFLPWLDPATYVLVPNGALEQTSGWRLSGGAAPVAGNEPFRVNSPGDARALSLPSGSSATSPPLCVTLLHPTLRFFAANTGSPAAALRVDAVTSVLGLPVTTPVGLLLAGRAWQPTLPLAFLDHLVAPLGGTVSFRFTPVGQGSGWRIDYLYVDPFKGR
jgi:hypothetical protein